MLKNWGKGHKRKQGDQLGNQFSDSSERHDKTDLEKHLRKLDNLRDILELKSKRLGSNWYQHEKILEN